MEQNRRPRRLVDQAVGATEDVESKYLFSAVKFVVEVGRSAGLAKIVQTRDESSSVVFRTSRRLTTHGREVLGVGPHEMQRWRTQIGGERTVHRIRWSRGETALNPCRQTMTHRLRPGLTGRQGCRMRSLEPTRKVSREKECYTGATNDFHTDDPGLAEGVAAVAREPVVHRRAVSEALARSQH